MQVAFARIIAAAFVALSVLAAPVSSSAATRTKFTLAWTVYVGWMPWPYAAEAGIVKKWASKYKIDINVVQINDYVESLNQFTAGKIDAVTAANMDALTVPAAGGVGTRVILVGDFSNGNDGIVLKGAKSLADIKGRRVNLVELSVSHYLLARALGTVGLSERDIKTVNTADADIVSAFQAPAATAVVTWNPQLSVVRQMKDTMLAFDSSKIPGEIIDTTIVRENALTENPDFAKALTGIWYETIALMARKDATGVAAREAMAKLSGTNLAGFESQLSTTRMFYDAKEAAEFTSGAKIIESMDHVRKFSFAHNLLGEGAKSPDAVGIGFAGDKTLGNKANIKLRFDATYMLMAAQGKL